MIRFFRFVAPAVLLLSALTGTAQEKSLTEKEFNSVWKAACEKTSRVSHVFTDTSEEYFYDSKTPYTSYVSVKRYTPPDRVWTIAGRKGGKDENKYEEIRIGRKSYSRDGTGPWKFQELGFSGLYYCEPETSMNLGKGNGSGSSDGSQSPMTFEHEYKYVGRKELGAESVDLYVHVKRMIVKNSGAESRTAFQDIYWINHDGLFLRSESTTTMENSQRWSRRLGEYDYTNMNWKIEAPIR